MEKNHNNCPNAFLAKEQLRYTKKPEPTISIREQGINNLTFPFLLSEPHKAMFLRSDRYYDVFIIIIPLSGDVFGTWMPERGWYPSNKDFGVGAWIFNKVELVNKKYLEL